MATYKHIRSNVDSKRPTTSLADGQIAINTNVASPGVFFKDSAGTGIVKVGPVHVGTSAPNSTPGAGGSTGNSKGEQWLDTSLTPAQLKVWNGSAWVSVVADELPVSKLQHGSAYQLLQTDAAGTGVEWASNIDVPGSLNVTSTAVFDSTASHPLGSAAAPTITFTGDANTGIYSPGIDQIALSTAGTSRLHVAADGKIGVGTASPGTTFDINGDLTIADKIIHRNDTNTAIRFPAADTVSIQTANVERVRVNSAGNLGVGTSSPSVKLDVNGDVNIASSGEFRIAGTKVLDATSLGSAVVSSSLTSVGTIGTGVWNGTAIATAYIADSAVTSAKIANSTITNADVNASAAIAGTKISPNFGSQAVTTTGLISANGKVSFPLGSAGAPGLYPGSDTNTGIYSPGANQLAITTSGNQRLNIESDGDIKIDGGGMFYQASSNRLGIGTTSPGVALHVNGDIRCDGVYGETDTNTSIKFPGGDVITFNEGGGERARIDSSGRLLVGTSSVVLSSSDAKIQFASSGGASLVLGRNDSSVSTNNDLGLIRFYGNDGGSYQEGARISAQADGSHASNDKPTKLVFFTTADGASSPTQRMRLDNRGQLALQSTTTTFEVATTRSSGIVYSLIYGRHSATSGSPGTGTLSFRVSSNGNVVNSNNSYGSISDIKLKENIVDAESQWDDFKAVRFRKYNFKEETGHETFTQLGVIAQELELVSPGLVTDLPDLDKDGNDLGTTTKGVKYSVLTKKALVALQEAMERIETLEQRLSDAGIA